MNSKVNQLILQFPHQPDYSADNFLPLPFNKSANSAVESFPTKEGDILVVYGPKGSGKTHLLRKWTELRLAKFVNVENIDDVEPREGLYAVDDLQELNIQQQEKLFHIFNYMKGIGGSLVVASQIPVAQLNLIPELRSRLLLGTQAELTAPQESDLKLLLVKWSQDRQLKLEQTVISYILSHCERSPQVLEGIVEALDTLSLAQKRKITIPLVRDILSEQ